MNRNTPGEDGTGVQVQFVLISHTNNGKTTLARTLLGADIGEVRDAAHVTTTADSHVLLQTDQADALLLWDTPGFGDSVRLSRRLAMSGNPIGWFLSQVVDRLRDRPFWLSQQALRAARDAADVVLYLVNATEDPRDTGYLAPEMKILAWLGKPVLVLLNQTGAPRPAAVERAEEARWSEQLAEFPIVRQVLTLDAFTRCWVHERVFYEAVGRLLAPGKQAGYARLRARWEADNAQRLARAMQATAAVVAQAAGDREAVDDKAPSRVRALLRMVGVGADAAQRSRHAAMDRMLARLQDSIAQGTAQMLAAYRIPPGAAAEINARVQEHFVLKAPVDQAQAGLLGAILSGAGVGLKADLVSGGLSMGAGAVVGGVVGALTFAGAAWGFNALDGRQTPTVRYSDDFLHGLLAAGVLRYLAIAHFGRGRGSFEEQAAPAFWRSAVDEALATRAAALARLWPLLRDTGTADAAAQELAALVSTLTEEVLQRLYPAAEAVNPAG